MGLLLRRHLFYLGRLLNHDGIPLVLELLHEANLFIALLPLFSFRFFPLAIVGTLEEPLFYLFFLVAKN